jgi:uncharacterized OB-fold protein
MTTMQRPLPVQDSLSANFWKACRNHKLSLQQCSACATAQFPPGPVCKKCRSTDLQWIESTGRGTVYSWIVVRHPVPKEIYGPEVPYVVALVDLEEGPRMPTNIVGCAPEDVTAHMKVQVVFRDLTDEVSLPQFTPILGSTPNR